MEDSGKMRRVVEGSGRMVRGVEALRQTWRGRLFLNILLKLTEILHHSQS